MMRFAKLLPAVAAASLLAVLAAVSFSGANSRAQALANAPRPDDDSASFAAAMDQAMRSGQPFVLQAGRTYRLWSWKGKPLSAAITIIGNGATIQGPANVDFIASQAGSTAQRFSISGVRFEGWRSIVNFRNDKAAPYGGNADGFGFANNVVRHHSGYALNIECGAAGYQILGNQITDGANGIRIGWNDFAAATGWQGQITGNTLARLSTDGSDLHGIIAYGHDTLIANNTISGLAAHGKGSVFGIYTKLAHSTVRENDVSSLSGEGPESVAINLKGTEPGMTVAPNGNGTAAIDNRIRGNGVPGRKGAGIRLQSDDQAAIGNTIEAFGEAAVVVDEANGQTGIRIERNVVVGTGAVGERGIEISSLGRGKVTRDVLIDGNSVTNCRAGLFFGGAGTHENVRITDNTFTAGAAGGDAGIEITRGHVIQGLDLARNRISGRFSESMSLPRK